MDQGCSSEKKTVKERKRKKKGRKTGTLPSAGNIFCVCVSETDVIEHVCDCYWFIMKPGCLRQQREADCNQTHLTSSAGFNQPFKMYQGGNILTALNEQS